MLFLIAIIPSIIIFIMVYRMDKIEREPKRLLLRIFLRGVLSTFVAMLVELALSAILGVFFDEKSLVYMIVDNFLITAFVEEQCKYRAMKRPTWNHEAFNYTFDGIVYAVTAALGFATLENILYVEDIGTGVLRGFTAVPGHCIDAVFMGLYYGAAKYYDRGGLHRKCKHNLRLAIWVPTLMHGFYDFALATENDFLIALFFVYCVVSTIVAIYKIRKAQKYDKPM